MAIDHADLDSLALPPRKPYPSFRLCTQRFQKTPMLSNQIEKYEASHTQRLNRWVFLGILLLEWTQEKERDRFSQPRPWPFQSNRIFLASCSPAELASAYLGNEVNLLSRTKKVTIFTQQKNCPAKVNHLTSPTDNALSIQLALEVAGYFRVSDEKATEIISVVQVVVYKWESIAEKVGIPKSERNAMAKAFRY